jgi:predicted HTH domain antitoxin
MAQTSFSVDIPGNLLNLGIGQDVIKRRISEWMVFSLFSDGIISSGKAGKLLGITRVEFIQLMQTRGLAFINYTEDEIKEELESVEKLDIKSEE